MIHRWKKALLDGVTCRWSIVGADGVRSVVRQLVFGAGDLRWTGHQCYRALVPTGGVVDHVAPESAFWMGTKAYVVTYYVKGGQAVNIVAVTEAAEWVAESWSTRASRDEMLKDFEGWDPDLQKLFADVKEVYNWGLFDCPSSDDLGHEGLIEYGGPGSLGFQSMLRYGDAASGASR